MNIDKFTIEPVSHPAISSLRDAVDDVARERRFLMITSGFSLAATEEFVGTILAGRGVQCVAIEDGKVIGWCDVIRKSHEGCEHVGTLGMGVLKSARNKGIGKALLLATMDSARRLGLTRIELEVFSTNTIAIQLYEKAGFIIEGCKKNARVLDGTIDDIICMAAFRK